MNLGLLGGSFDPPHLGHIAMAEAARRAHALDRVLLIPSGSPPHKQDLSSAADRLEMVRLAAAGHEGLAASDIEVRRPGVTYTIDTLEELGRLHPGAELYFIVGEDSLKDLPAWREPARILQLARLVVVNRPGARAALTPADLPGVPEAIFQRIECDRVTMPPCPFESRRIRAELRAGNRSHDGLAPAVLEYILRRGLYAGC
jgi:nicotinate-nucleotide adenylyltransferase